MNVADVARRIGALLEADGIDYAIGGALALGVWGAPRGTKDVDLCVMKLVYGRDKDHVDLERLFAVQPALDLGYIRDWVGRMPVAPGSQAALASLIRRFRPETGG